MDRQGQVVRARALLLAVAVAVAGIVTAVVLTVAAVVVVGVIGVDVGPVGAVVLTLLVTGVGFVAVSSAYLSYTGFGWSFVGVRVPGPSDLAWVGGGYLLALVSVVIAATAVFLLGGQAAPNQVGEAGLETPALLLLLVPINLLVVGPGEELLFRGVVQGRLREAFGPASAIVLASAIFAAVHFVALSGGVGARLTTIAILFLPSLVFGAAYERTGNLVVNALIHGLYNSTLSLLLYVALQVGGSGAVA